MSKKTIIASLVALIFTFFTGSVSAIKLIYKDNKGHYHYRCTDKAGGKTVVIYRSEGVYINGPAGQQFIRLKTATLKRSEDNIKKTETFARIGCREHKQYEMFNRPYVPENQQQ